MIPAPTVLECLLNLRERTSEAIAAHRDPFSSIHRDSSVVPAYRLSALRAAWAALETALARQAAEP